jgi:uncharacterized membrane protein
MESNISSKNKNNLHGSFFGFKLSTILIIISILLSIVIILRFSHNNQNDMLPTRTRNRYPTLQRRNAMKEEDIEKILKKLEKVSENVKKNLK